MQPESESKAAKLKTMPFSLRGLTANRLTLTLTGRGERRRASGPVERVVRRSQTLGPLPRGPRSDRKSTRLNSSHGYISYAVFCLKKKKKCLTLISIQRRLRLRV